MKDSPLPVNGGAHPASGDRPDPDPRLEEARRVLGELEESEGADALAPARRLADLLEDALEGEAN